MTSLMLAAACLLLIWLQVVRRGEISRLAAASYRPCRVVCMT